MQPLQDSERRRVRKRICSSESFLPERFGTQLRNEMNRSVTNRLTDVNNYLNGRVSCAKLEDVKALRVQVDLESFERGITFLFLLTFFSTPGVSTRVSIDWKRPALEKKSKKKKTILLTQDFFEVNLSTKRFIEPDMKDE
jgi:hypothetical protein